MRFVGAIKRLPILMAFFISGCSTFLGNKSYTVEKDVVFKSIDGEQLKVDLYLPEVAGRRPAVVVVHGGGWNRRSGDMELICRSLARSGYAAFNTTYRLAPAHHFPKQVDDTRDAILWVKANAAKYGVDPERIAGWGYSAGSNLVLLAGLDPNVGLKAIVAGGTPADLTAWPDSPLVRKLIGSNLTERADLWHDASPVNHVQTKSPPVFLYHGQWDHIVEVEQMEKMATALKSKNIEVETHEVSFRGHITTYFFSPGVTALGIDFLNRHLKAE